MKSPEEIAAKYGGAPVSPDDIAKKYGGTPVDTSSHGASGGWEEPAKDYSQTPVLGTLARFGRGAVDAATTLAKAPGDIAVAASTPQTPGEYKLPFVGLAAKRLLYEPTIENAKAWWEDMKARAANTPDAPSFLQSAADAMGMVPLVGPLVKDLMETAGSGDIAGAVGKATTFGLAPKATEGVKEVIKGTDTYKYAQSRPLLITTPEGHLQTALKPDLDPQGLTLATQMLKEGEKRIGQPVKDIDTAKAAERAQFEKDLMPTRRSIIDPQKDVVLPGSRRQMIQAKIDAIPKDIQPGTPAYDDLVTSIRASVPKDLTIGELEDISSSLNSQNRGLHAAKFSQALTKMESANSAIDAATEFASRKLMQDGMDKFGRGGAEALRKVNERIGVGIKIRDAIDAAEKQARTEAVMPRLQRGVRGTTVNEGIANAMRTMRTKAPPIKPNLSPPMLTTGTDTSAVSAMTTRWEDLSPEEMAHLHQLGISSDVVRKMYAERMGSVNTDAARRDPATGELLLPSHKITPITTSTAGGDVTQLQHNGVTYGEGGVETISGKQQPLQPTVIRPKTTRPSTPIFGESQHLAEGVPPGTKLAFKTKGLTGDMYHYETPDGRIITLDHELSPEFSKTPPATPYEPGTSHNRTPQPPKRSSAAPDKTDTGGEPASVSGPAPKRSSTIERPVDFKSTRTRIRGLTEPPKRNK